MRSIVINRFILELFKFSTLLHAFLLLTTIIIKHLLPTNDLLYLIIDYGVMLAALTTSMCVTTKGMQYFIMHHKRLMSKYKSIGLIIEFIIINSMVFTFFINEEITGQFILFINDLSLSAHDNKIIAIMILIGVYLSIKFYHGLHIHQIYIQHKSLLHLMSAYIIDLMLKISILSCLALGLFHPVSKALETFKILEFAKFTFNNITIALEIYSYILSIITIAILFCIMIYYAYIYYKKIKRKTNVR